MGAQVHFNDDGQLGYRPTGQLATICKIQHNQMMVYNFKFHSMNKINTTQQQGFDVH